MDMGDRIREYRKKLGLTQQELGEKLGLQKAAISKFERGHVQNIKRSTIQRMSEIFGCTPSELLCIEQPTMEEMEDMRDQLHASILVDVSGSFGPDASKLVEMYDSFDKELKQRLMAYAAKLSELKEME